MLSKLPPRERQIVALLYRRGPLATNQICDGLPDRLSGSAVRAMLKRLTDKGFVRREAGENGFVYRPVITKKAAVKSTLSELVRTFFDGSPVSAATALLGMSNALSLSELDELEQIISETRARREADL